jgi:hypothetical protein
VDGRCDPRHTTDTISPKRWRSREIDSACHINIEPKQLTSCADRLIRFTSERRCGEYPSNARAPSAIALRSGRVVSSTPTRTPLVFFTAREPVRLGAALIARIGWRMDEARILHNNANRADGFMSSKGAHQRASINAASR